MTLETLLKKAKGFSSVRSRFPNQSIVYLGNMTILTSYNTIIAIKYYNKGETKVYLTKDWDYSSTTSKHRNDFLFEEKKDTQKKLDSGVYIYLKD